MAMVTTNKQYEFCDDIWGVIMSYAGVTEYITYGGYNGKYIIDINYLRTEGEYGIFKNSYRMFDIVTRQVTSHKYHQARKEDALVKYKLQTLKRSRFVYPEFECLTINPIVKYTRLNYQTNTHIEFRDKIRIRVLQKRNKRHTTTTLTEDDVYVDGLKLSPRTHFITNHNKVEQYRQCVNIKTGEIREDSRVIKPAYSIVTRLDVKSNKYKEGTKITDL